MRDREAAAAATHVICVHGAGAGGWEWAIWARIFAVYGFDVLAPDLMPSRGGLAATRLEDYRIQVIEWCDGVAAAPILVGASLGGLLALAVARAVDAAALVLVNPLPAAGLARLRNDSRAVIPWRSARALAGTFRAMPDADDAARLFAFRRWRDESGAVLRTAAAGIAIEPPACPVLVLAGELDRDVAVECSRSLAQELGADFEQVAGASHVGPVLGSAAASSAEQVVRWLLARRVSACEGADLTAP